MVRYGKDWFLWTAWRFWGFWWDFWDYWVCYGFQGRFLGIWLKRQALNSFTEDHWKILEGPGSINFNFSRKFLFKACPIPKKLFRKICLQSIKFSICSTERESVQFTKGSCLRFPLNENKNDFFRNLMTGNPENDESPFYFYVFFGFRKNIPLVKLNFH